MNRKRWPKNASEGPEYFAAQFWTEDYNDHYFQPVVPKWTYQKHRLSKTVTWHHVPDANSEKVSPVCCKNLLMSSVVCFSTTSEIRTTGVGKLFVYLKDKNDRENAANAWTNFLKNDWEPEVKSVN